MSMTANEIATQARRLLADSLDVSFTDADLLAYINEGMRRFAEETHCCQAVVDASVSASPYVAASLVSAGGSHIGELLHVTNVVCLISGEYTHLFRASITEVKNWSSSKSTPTRYWVYGTSIYFDTAPTFTALTMRFMFSYIPVDLTSLSDNILIPVVWAPAIVKYTAYSAFLSQRDAGLASGCYNEFQQIATEAAAITKGRAG